MASEFQAAVRTANEILALYHEQHGAADFPTIKGKLLPLIEARATVDNIYVKRFKEAMYPIVGQLRRIRESNGPYMSVEEHGVIYLCPTLDLDWHRFITIKEASHLILDTPEDYVKSAIDIDSLLVCLAQFGPKETTKHYVSEQKAMVCAQEMLFPRATREKLREQYNAGKVSAIAIAKAGRIPTQVVREIMGENYTAFVNGVYAEIELDDAMAKAAE
jgi:Zn-dependent peptidase ImmA (M78 family)